MPLSSPDRGRRSSRGNAVQTAKAHKRPLGAKKPEINSRKGPRPATVTALDRAARVLAAFAQSWDFLTLVEVAKLAGLSKPTTFRILATLMSEGLIFQNEANATYGFGFQTLRLADVIVGTLPLIAAIRPIMRDINSKLNETVVLSAQEGLHCYFVHSVETSQSIGQTHALGIGALLHTVAPGRAILAAWPDQDIQDYVRRCRHTQPSIRAAELFHDIEQIRAHGFARSSGELRHGGNSLAMAISSTEGRANSALHVSFPQGRYSKDLYERCIEALRAGIAAISAAAALHRAQP